MASVQLTGVDAVIGGIPVQIGAQTVQLVDSTTSVGGDGRYIVALMSTSTYFVVRNAPYLDSTSSAVICHAAVIGGSPQIVDKRNRQVSGDAVAATIAHVPFSDGSYLQSNVVTARALSNLTVVRSLNSQSDNVVLKSSDGSVTIIPGSGAIDLRAASSGGGGGTTNAFDTDVIAGTLAPVFTNYYKMNESSGTAVVDAMANANGTYSGTFLFRQTQLCADSNPVAFFQSVNSNKATLNDPTTTGTAFTVMVAWKQAGPSTTGVLLSNYTGGSAYVILYLDTANNLNFQFNGGASVIATASGSGPHIAFVTFDGTYASSYFDGIATTKTSATYTKQASGWVAGQHPAGTNAVNACIGKVGIAAATAFTSAQVAALSAQFLFNN